MINLLSKKFFLFFIFAFITVFNIFFTQVYAGVLVKSTEIKNRELFDTVKLIGKCKNESSREYYAEVTGRVDYVTSNQKIKAGDLIMSIDSNIAQNIKNQAISTLDTANEYYNRQYELHKKGFLSKELLDNAMRKKIDAQLQYSEKIKLYDSMIIHAPYDCQVTVIKFIKGDKVNTGDYLFNLITKEDKLIFVDLPEKLFNKVSIDTEVIIHLKNKETKSKISTISSTLSSDVSLVSKINFIDEDQELLNGSFLDVTLILNKHIGLSIEKSCIMKNDQGSLIYKIEDNKVKQIYVKLGTRTNNFIELLDCKELQEGDKVILEGLTKVAEGVEVRE